MDNHRIWRFGVLLLMLAAFSVPRSDFVGQDNPDGFSLCEAELDGDGEPRPECQAGDLRIWMDHVTAGRAVVARRRHHQPP